MIFGPTHSRKTAVAFSLSLCRILFHTQFDRLSDAPGSFIFSYNSAFGPNFVSPILLSHFSSDLCPIHLRQLPNALDLPWPHTCGTLMNLSSSPPPSPRKLVRQHLLPHYGLPLLPRLHRVRLPLWRLAPQRLTLLQIQSDLW